ncbi:MFS transporter [Sphingomonas sp. Tas61C01]|uniref:MFS transporter n=1 Tax=Sphingomonas sp. Tas61C01 TaxID=3458297 RepID=UPI00403EBC6B
MKAHFNTPEHRSTWFLLIYALGYAGGVIGYLPLLTLLLPIKVDAVAGSARLDVFALVVVLGSLAASLSYIVFGWLTDRSVERGGGRRRWMLGGAIATGLSYATIAAAESAVALVLAVVAFQIAVNIVLAPLAAIMADEVPDTQKGVAGGLLALANPVAAALSAVLVGLSSIGSDARLAIVPLALALCVMPLLLTKARPIAPAGPTSALPSVPPRDLVLAWSARLLVQIAGSALFVYLFYYLESVARTVPPATIAARMGVLMIVAYVVPLPVAVWVGWLADRWGRTKPFLLAASAVGAAGLVGMALAEDFATATAAFCVYTAGASVFLALHASFAMQLLPNARHRGRDLGLINLTNTLPSMLGPALTWLLATPADFDAVLLVLAALTLCGGFVIQAATGRR